MELQYQITKEQLIVPMPKEVDHHIAKTISREIDFLIIDSWHVRKLIFDFAETDFMDSSGIGVLIGRKKTMDMHRGEICARNLGERAQKIFDKSGLAQIILVESGREEKQ